MSRKNRDRGWADASEALPSPVPDNHTHLESVLGVQAEPGPRTLDDHLELAASVGVPRMVQVGCDLESVAWTDAVLRADAGGPGADGPVPMTTRRGVLLGAIAIHPNEAVLHAGVRETAPDGLDPDPQPWHDTSLADALATVERVARANPRVRAIGETGLDYFRAGERGRAVQREAFRAHIALAKELGLALQIHDRDAHDDVVELLRRDGAPERTVFHCFSGGPALAEVCAQEGWFASFAGPVTFGANDELRAALRVLPVEQVMVETDAPYLTPHPMRGRPNAPYQLPLTVRRIATELNQDLRTLCETLTRTTERVYGSW